MNNKAAEMNKRVGKAIGSPTRAAPFAASRQPQLFNKPPKPQIHLWNPAATPNPASEAEPKQTIGNLW